MRLFLFLSPLPLNNSIDKLFLIFQQKSIKQASTEFTENLHSPGCSSNLDLLFDCFSSSQVLLLLSTFWIL